MKQLWIFANRSGLCARLVVFEKTEESARQVLRLVGNGDWDLINDKLDFIVEMIKEHRRGTGEGT
jgi:hypothetical protein